MSNQAAWITEAKANPLQVKEAPMPTAAKGQVVIKNKAIAVNPVDCKYTRDRPSSAAANSY
jgi:NADPH:quinone reductase-like Zn-dependent oxidoreductase